MFSSGDVRSRPYQRAVSSFSVVLPCVGAPALVANKAHGIVAIAHDGRDSRGANLLCQLVGKRRRRTYFMSLNATRATGIRRQLDMLYSIRQKHRSTQLIDLASGRSKVAGSWTARNRTSATRWGDRLLHSGVEAGVSLLRRVPAEPWLVRGQTIFPPTFVTAAMPASRASMFSSSRAVAWPSACLFAPPEDRRSVG